MVLVMYSLYPTLVSSTASMFNCTDAINGVRYLVHDLTVTCYVGWHNIYLFGASMSIVVYCFGTPIALAAIIMWDIFTCTAPRLFKHRLKKATGSGEGDNLDGAVPDPQLDGTRCGKCRCICQLRSSTPWGFRTASVVRRHRCCGAACDAVEVRALISSLRPPPAFLRSLSSFPPSTNRHSPAPQVRSSRVGI